MPHLQQLHYPGDLADGDHVPIGQIYGMNIVGSSTSGVSYNRFELIFLFELSKTNDDG